MPEDEAIDFTFKMGVDTAHGVAQSMSEESTLKREDVPQGTIKQKKILNNQFKPFLHDKFFD